jgi:hypothetical protein
MATKGDYTKTGPKQEFEVIDEVSFICGDTRYALEKLRFKNGTELIRVPYWTIEGRLRPGAHELRVGFGQFSPILPLDVFFGMVEQALQKGWRA